MKLTTQQIGYVSNYIQSFDIKWYEIQVELTDHFVSIMEEIWDKNPELTFLQVKYKAEQRFGTNYFKQVEKDRRIILQQEFNRSQWKVIVGYLKFPKIIMSSLAFIVIYKCSFYFNNTSHYIQMLSFIFMILCIIHNLIGRFYYRKIRGERFLALETTFRTNTSYLIAYIVFSGISEKYLQVKYALFLACGLFVLGISLIVTGYQLTNKIISNIKKQYKLT
jgi:hypothetical protein